MKDILITNNRDLYFTIVNIANKCINYLSNLKNIENTVVVFDIDNTLLDKKYKVIEPIRAVYYYCNMLGITTAIITSRYGNKKTIEITKKQLTDAFIGDIGFFYFIKQGSKNPFVSKEKARLNIEERGYKIVMSIGDQQYDITGRSCGLPIQIPVINEIDFSYIKN